MVKRLKKAKIEDPWASDGGAPVGLAFETITQSLDGTEVTGRLGMPVDAAKEASDGPNDLWNDLWDSEGEVHLFAQAAVAKVADLLGLRPADITVTWKDPGPATFPKVEVGFRLYGKHAPTEDALKKVRALMFDETDSFKKRMNRKAKVKKAAVLLDEEKKAAAVRARLAAPAAKLSDASLVERLALRMAEKRVGK